MIILLVLIRSLSNDDSDGNEKGKKKTQKVLLTKHQNLHVHHAFFVHFLAVVVRPQREGA